ncbi:MAG: diguanylate cyclase/phosphodiesterase (GGDEF & EAL domains) with PAS/PAC sensor(s) [Candidatus Saccharicenans subterraneus]|uniref:Diguanylate cyclase/phosphodiesterase (GGDEF & EAL domains) with PAS/PAC sensor(S) n=1 Tax=Candidatus Saccharicenans subterraneus TaxID=2508984 RepID=A0A3E2BKB6_9BACT|nr:MAG: diguanylate cyclase/phosphodiesterase (GGDEF & EAL domains) with PAS/PAC sensor(s) [Candidatus Saccharicenans subterraneum]
MPLNGTGLKVPRKRTWIIFFLALAILFLSIGLWYLNLEIRHIRQAEIEKLVSTANLKIQGLNQWRRERLSDAVNLAKSPLLASALKAWLASPGNLQLKQDILDRLSLSRQAYGYADILVLDPEGRLLLSLQPEVELLLPQMKKYLDRALQSREAFLTDLYRSSSGQIVIDCLAPVIARDHSIPGIIVLRSRAADFLFPLIQSWPTPSKTAETLLVSRDGDEVVYLNELRHRSDTALNLRIPLSETSIPAVQAVLGKEGIFEGRDYRGQKVVADLRPVSNSSWFMVAKIDKSEIMAEARHHGAAVIIIIGLLLLLGAVLAFFGYHQQKIRYYRALFEAEKKQRQTQEELRTTLYSIGDAVITTDTRGIIKMMNPVAERLTGWPETEAAGRPLTDVFRIINEETRSEVQNPVERVLREGVVVGLANHTVLVSRHGQEIPIADAGAPIRDFHGEITGVILVFRDQTQERAAQRALEESEEKYRIMVENSHAGVLIVGQDYKFIYVNQKLCEMLGRSPEEIIGHDFREFLDEESLALVADRYVRRQRGEEVPSRYEFNVVRKDGEKRRVEIISAIVRDSKEKTITVAQLLDITERKRAEEALRASEEKYRILHEFAGEAIFTYTLDLKLLEINRAACDFVGMSREELIGQNVLELGVLHPDDKEKALENLRAIIQGERKINTGKLRFKGRSGLYSTFLVTSTPVVRNGEIVAITNICRDVTVEERLLAELEASERKYRFLFNAGNDAIFVYRLTADRRPGPFIEANELASQLTGYTKAELMQLTPMDLVVPEERELVLVSNQEFGEKKQRIFERTLLTRDGRRIPIEISSHYFALNGEPTILAIARDITERKRVEAELRAALKEKDVMLREIHHRVKNNMQVMSSLLRLQMAQIADSQAREAFRKSQARIQSMAMIHERLYQSGNLASIDFADYVDKLVTHLYVVYEVDHERVHFKNETGQVGLDINQAIPCGLIVSELVSNALKHAFPGKQKGELLVRVFRGDDGKIHLIIKDSGKAMPAGIDLHKSETLGFQIVNDLTRQLDGKLHYRRNGGNEFEIIF